MKTDAVSHFVGKAIYSKNKLLHHFMYSLAKFFSVFSQLTVSHAIFQNVCSVG